MKILYFMCAVALFAFFSYQSPKTPARAFVALQEMHIKEIAVPQDEKVANDWLQKFEEETDVYREPVLEDAVLIL